MAVPFTIVDHADQPPTASNGKVAITCPDPGGRVFLRRGIRTNKGSPIAQRILPYLNQLAGQILASPDMPEHEIAARLHELQVQCVQPTVENIEWACAELEVTEPTTIRCFTDGQVIVLTKEDLKV